MSGFSRTHSQRIHQELIDAGMSAYALIKPMARYVPTVIHEDEHIQAVAYGRYAGGSGMLIGTDRRVLFLDHKPGVTICDEMSFDIIAGIKSAHVGPFASVTLHSRVNEYELKYVNHISAEKFVRYIEQRRVEGSNVAWIQSDTLFKVALEMSPDARSFLLSHDTAVLSTAARNGDLHGAVVHYVVGPDDKIYVLTKSETSKARNIRSNQNIAFTIYDPDPAQTMQLQGVATIVTDQHLKDDVFNQLTKPREYKDGRWSPPVTSLRDGAFVAISITPTTASYRPNLRNSGAIQ